jgi:hypothetical protein
VNLVNGPIYIGSSVNLGVCLLAYVQYLIRNATLLIVKGIVTYGIANFVFVVLETCPGCLRGGGPCYGCYGCYARG